MENNHGYVEKVSSLAPQNISLQELIAPILQRIANSIVSFIDAEWSVVVVTGEMADGSVELECMYQDVGQTNETPFFAPSEVLHEFSQMWLLLKAQTGDEWEKVRFALHPDGSFDIDFTYLQKD